MLNKVDEKGKVFTARVRKLEVEVHIVTVQGDVHGYIHIQPGHRVKDLLNNPAEQFLAITGATVYSKTDIQAKTSAKASQAKPKADATSEQLISTQVDFLALNKQFIISVVPIDEDKLERRRDEEYYIPR